MTQATHDPHAPAADREAQAGESPLAASEADPQAAVPAADSVDAADEPLTAEAGEQAPADEASEPAAAGLTERQLHAAEKFGFSPEDLAALGDRAAAFAERLVKLDSELGRRYGKLGQLAKQLKARQGGQADPADEADAPGAFDPAGATDTPEPHRPAETTANNGLADRVEALQQQLAELAASQRQAQRQQNRQTAERFFAALDAELYPQFGEGLTDDLPDDSDALQQRRRLLAKAGEIRGGYELVHGQKMDPSEALKQALAVVAPEGPVAAERKRIAESVRLARGRQVARPSGHRRGELADPAQRTAEVLAEWQRTRGVRFFMD